MNQRATLDVSSLPHAVMDHRSPIWWGNLLLLFIESTMFGILVGAYFYLRMNFAQWPPAQTVRMPPNLHPLPSLMIPTANLVLMLVSIAPMAWTDLACLKRDPRAIRIGLALCVLAGAGMIALRFFEFGATNVRWDDNAYGSIVWMILGMHLVHLFVCTLELGLMEVWLLVQGLDDKHARDIRVTATYWYWVVGIWIPLYAIVYWYPRITGGQ